MEVEDTEGGSGSEFNPKRSAVSLTGVSSAA